jgi:hypothetical protein
LHIIITDRDQNTITHYLFGFIIGAVIGVLLILHGITLYNLYCHWQGCAPMTYTLWKFIPLPLILGAVMSFFTANFSDMEGPWD